MQYHVFRKSCRPRSHMTLFNVQYGHTTLMAAVETAEDCGAHRGLDGRMAGLVLYFLGGGNGWRYRCRCCGDKQERVSQTGGSQEKRFKL